MKHLDEMKSLAELVRTLPKKSFEMGRWRSPCGTVACAIGHGILSGILSGMTMAEDVYHRPFPVFGGSTEYFAIADYFAITIDDACMLFSPIRYEGKKLISDEHGMVNSFTDREAVASRIEAFIAAHEPSVNVEVKSMHAAPVLESVRG